MNNFAKYGIYPVLALLLMTMTNLIYAQEIRATAVGTFNYNAKEDFTQATMDFPRGYRNYDTDMANIAYSYGVEIGVRMDWTDAAGAPHTVKVFQVWGGCWPATAGEIDVVDFKRIWKDTPPSKVVDGTDYAEIFFATDPVDASIPSDVKIHNKATTWVDIDLERNIYAYANDEHDDYVIMEHIFTNNSGEAKQGVYFGFQTNFDTKDSGIRWNNYYGGSYADYVTGDPTADSMRTWYAWDADEQVTLDIDDRGEPSSDWGNFTKAQYMGFVVLHADKSAANPTDDPTQPKKAGWASFKSGTAVSFRNDSHETIYDFLSQSWTASPVPIPDLNTYNDAGWIRLMPPDFDYAGSDPKEEPGRSALLSFGPYNLADGEDVRIVLAICGGAINPRLVIDAGLAYDNGYAGQIEVRPMPYAVPGICSAGETLTKAQKNDLLDTAQDSLFANVSKAIWNWKGEFGSGPLMVPMPPASPSIELASEPGKIEISWEAVTGASGYRIYRNYYRPPEITFPTDTSWVLVDDVGSGVTGHNDSSVVRGRQYWYYLTAYNQAGESSPFLNLTSGTGQAVSPTRAWDPNWLENVVVVPNPYHVRALKKYVGKQINFFNLPPYCNIHIYSMTGDRVQTLEHTSGTGDEPWERQLTFSNQQITSGVYFFVVEGLDEANGSPTGKLAKGKFIVIN